MTPISDSPDYFTVVTWSLDFRTKVTIHSSNVKKVKGYSAQQFQENPMLWKQIVHPDDHFIIDQFELELYSGKASAQEYRIIHADGSVRWIEDRAIPLFDNNMNLIGLQGINLDITEFKKAEEQNRNLEYKQAPQGKQPPSAVLLINPDGTFRHITPSTGILGIPAKQLIGKSALEFVHPEALIQIEKKLKDIKSSRFLTIHVKNKGGEWEKIDIHCSPIFNEEGILDYIIMIGWNLSDHMADSGKRLRMIMSEKNINTAELADRSGVSQATISNLKTGKVTKPTIQTAQRIVDALEVNVTDVWPYIRY